MKKFLLGLFALGLMTSCVKEVFVVETQQNTPDFVVTATLEETPATRTQLSYDNGYKTVWSSGDAINVNNMLGSYKFILVKGANTPNAEFANDPTYSGVSAGTEDGNTFSGSGMVAVYPFNPNLTSTIEGNDVVVNTEIPANQTFSVGSFGQNASPMVAYNVAGLPQFSFKNVGTTLCMPLTGKGTIISAKLESASGVAIAGSVTVKAVAENDFIPTTTVTEAGVSQITLSCGEGIELSAEPTKFYFVLAPGTYEENDLVVTFTNSYGDYFQTSIPATLEYKRSEINTFKAREFEAQGTTELDLWVKAKAGAYMTAERIIPSVNNLNVEEWVKALMNQPDTKDRLEQAVTYLSLGQYDLVYDVLGGVPGFVKELKRYEAAGTYTQKVDYTGASYLKSMIDGVEKINDIESLLAFMNEFEKVYEASGIKNQLDESLGSIADNFDKYIDAFVDANYEKPEQDNTLSEEEAFAQYKNKIKSELDKSISTCTWALQKIDDIRINGYKFLWQQIVAPNTLDWAADEYNSIKSYLDAANLLIEKWSTLNDKSSIDTEINMLPTLKINLLKIIPVEIKPSDFLRDAGSEYEKYLNNLKDQILGNEELINAAKAYVRSEIEKIQDNSFVGSLETAVNEPDSWTGKVLNYLFSQETFLESVKKSLRDIVAGIEEDKKEEIDNGNVDLKAKAIESSKNNALLYARAEAIESIEKQLAATNEANLNGGPWGVFKKVLNWEKCVQLFTECGILDVYNVLCDFAAIVDKIYTFNRTTIYYDIENFADYQENVDWWVLKFNEEL